MERRCLILPYLFHFCCFSSSLWRTCCSQKKKMCYPSPWQTVCLCPPELKFEIWVPREGGGWCFVEVIKVSGEGTPSKWDRRGRRQWKGCVGTPRWLSGSPGPWLPSGQKGEVHTAFATVRTFRTAGWTPGDSSSCSITFYLEYLSKL